MFTFMGVDIHIQHNYLTIIHCRSHSALIHYIEYHKNFKTCSMKADIFTKSAHPDSVHFKKVKACKKYGTFSFVMKLIECRMLCGAFVHFPSISLKICDYTRTNLCY